MADGRRTLIFFKALCNLLLPVYPVARHRPVLSPALLLYILLAAGSVLTVVYILVKKARYNRIFLRKVYKPSNRLFLVFGSFEMPLTLALYGYLLYIGRNAVLGAIAAAHVLLSAGCLWYVHHQAGGYRVRINSFDNNFKLGVLAVQIGEDSDRGLQKGEIVKIVKTTSSGYLVKNSKGEEFLVDLSDIEEIIDIV